MHGKASVLQSRAPWFQRGALCLHLMGNNNGSAFGGLNVEHALLQYDGWSGDAVSAAFGWPFRRWRLAGSLARKKLVPPGRERCRPIHRLFVVMLDRRRVLVGALTFVPALALGPIVEHLTMIGL